MAATILVHCPQCKKPLNLPETLAGKKIRCKDCGTVFPVVKEAAPKPVAAPAKAAAEEEEGVGTYGFAAADQPTPVPAPAPPPPPPPPPAAARGRKGKKDDEDDPNPYGVTDVDLAPRCPHCAKEMESAEAIICLHCGYNTHSRKKADTKRIIDTTGQDQFMWLLPGILCIFGILFVVGFDVFFLFGLRGTWNYLSEEVLHSLSVGIRVWVVGASLFVIYKCGKFAVKRLILHPVPPEEEIK
jgi:uncharacterized protein YbaR (Trm112 family)